MATLGTEEGGHCSKVAVGGLPMSRKCMMKYNNMFSTSPLTSPCLLTSKFIFSDFLHQGE